MVRQKPSLLWNMTKDKFKQHMYQGGDHYLSKFYGLRSSRLSQKSTLASPLERFPFKDFSASSPRAGLDYH